MGEVVEVEQALHLRRRHSVGGGRGGVVLVVDFADQLLDQVLEGDDARGAAVLVHHERHMVTRAAHLRQGGQQPLAAGHPVQVPGQITHRGSRRAVGSGQEVAQMHEADHVVLRGVYHREPGVASGRGEPGCLGHAETDVEEDHLRARNHQLPHVAVASGKHVIDELTFHAVKHCALCEQVAQFRLGEMCPHAAPEQAVHPPRGDVGHANE